MTAARILVLGASFRGICGVREYAQVLETAFCRRGALVTTQWWERDPDQGLLGAVREMQEWAAEVDRAIREEKPDWVICHYSVFAYSHRGLPALIPLLTRRLSRASPRIVVVLHELAYAFGRRGWRGTVLAAAQRIALIPLVRCCDCAVVTTDQRVRWLRSRRWLPRRPVAFVPVCSTQRSAAPAPSSSSSAPTIGVFGYGAEGFVPAPVVEAVARLRARGLDPHLVLVGAPAETSRQAAVWRSAAGAAGCADTLRFTGPLEPSEVGAALQALDVLVFPDGGGPAARKTTLAAALACGKPVVALDGPYRWESLVRERAVVVSSPDGESLARDLEMLLVNDDLRRLQGKRAKAFYRREMDAEVVADRILSFLASIASMPGERC